MTREEMLNYSYSLKPYRKSMGKEKMAAQFMPFAALTGFDYLIIEQARTVEEKKQISSDKAEEINRSLQYIYRKKNVLISITYFVEDEFKIGGKYETKEDYVIKLDLNNKILVLKDGTRIQLKNIFDIEIKEDSKFYFDF